MGLVYFITGTDTGVGKTYVAASLLQRAVETDKRTGYIKPFQTGCREVAGILASPDVGEIKGALGPSVECNVLHLFKLPACPYLAAVERGVEIDFQAAIEWTRRTAEKYDFAVIEGAGGLLVPITAKQTMLDFIAELGYPVILIAANRLGCINHSLLSAGVLLGRGVDIKVLALNDAELIEDDKVLDANAGIIAEFAPSIRVVRLRHADDIKI